MKHQSPAPFRLPPAPSFSFLFLFVSLSVSHAAPLTRDAGEGLTYHRVTTLPADLPTAESSRTQPTILDLRYVSGDTAAATALHAWLKFHAATRAPVFLLVNADTAPALLAPFADHRPAGLLLIGPAASALKPDLVIKTTAVNERRAYDALFTGTPLATLLLDAPDKPRNDEASLMRDRLVDPTTYPQPADDISDDVADVPPLAPAANPKSPPPLVDAALQRAVHLHRALKALKKL